MSQPEGKIERVWALMQDIGVAMVVTHNGRGDNLRATHGRKSGFK
jgi:hypothetical protein